MDPEPTPIERDALIAALASYRARDKQVQRPISAWQRAGISSSHRGWRDSRERIEAEVVASKDPRRIRKAVS